MKKIFNPKTSLILSMAIFGTIGLFVSYIPLSSGEIALYRAVLAFLFVGIILLITKQKINFKEIKKELIILLISGMAMGMNWVFLFQSYKYVSVSISTLTYYFAPIIVTILCPIIFKEKMTLKQIICFIFSTVGLILIISQGSSAEGNKNYLLGIIYGLSAAMLYATVILLNKFIKTVEGLKRTFIQFFSSIIVLIPYVLMSGGLGKLESQKGLIALLIVGLIHTGVTYCLYFSSLKELKGQEAAILSYIDPLVAVVVSVVILKEVIYPLQIVGGILIIGFNILNEIQIKKINKTNSEYLKIEKVDNNEID